MTMRWRSRDSTDIYSQLGNTIGDFGEEVGALLHTFTGPIAEKLP